MKITIPAFDKYSMHFVQKVCLYKNHFCDGTPIVGDDRESPLRPKAPCPYYKPRGFLQSGCTHPERNGVKPIGYKANVEGV